LLKTAETGITPIQGKPQLKNESYYSLFVDRHQEQTVFIDGTAAFGFLIRTKRPGIKIQAIAQSPILIAPCQPNGSGPE